MSLTKQSARSREKRTLTIASLVAILLVTASFHLSAQGQWTRKADMPTARVGATASVVDNKIYVIGGYASGSVPNLSTNEVYNPKTNTWEAGLRPMPTPRSYAASAVLNGTICVFGGGYPNATAVNEAYTPATNSWDTTGVDLPWPRRSMSAAVVDSTIFLVGGSYDIRECCGYNPANPLSVWRLRTPMPAGGGALISLAVYNGLVYAFGGALGGSTSSWVGTSNVWAYNPKTDQWTAKKPMPTARFGLQTYLVGDSIYAIGGSQKQGTSLATVEVYHPLTDTWEQRPSLPQAVVGHAGALVKEQVSSTLTQYKLYVIGGTSNWSDMLNQVWEYGPLLTGAAEQSSQLPKEFVLEQNYPNPFNPTTVIKYTVGGFGRQEPGISNVKLVVYDLLGREVAVLVNEKKTPGTYEVSFDGAGLSSGVYIYRLTAGEYTECRKMVLMR